MNAIKNTTESEIAHRLKALPCLAGASSELVSLIASLSAIKKFRAGEKVWKTGDAGEFFAIVTAGLIEGNRHTGQSENTIIGLFGPGEVIGLPAALRRTEFPGTARVITHQTEVIKCFVRPALLGSAQTHLELHHWLREKLLAHSQTLQDKIDILGGETSETKILTLFLHLMRRYGKKTGSLHCYIPIPLTREQVGRLTKTRVETVIRLAGRLKKANLVHWDRSGIQIENVPAIESGAFAKFF